MKVVVIGGTGLIGSKLVSILIERGHDVLAASPRSGVDTVTGEGLDAALSGADVVFDVANSPSFEDKAVLAFFATAGRNLLAAESRAGVKHHIALSVVGTPKLLASGYFRAKMVQEKLIEASPIPYTIVRATQFFEFMISIGHSASPGDAVRLPTALMQPIAAADVSAALAEFVASAPLNAIVDLAGPERHPMNELVQQALIAAGDKRTVEADDSAVYFGVAINDHSLTPDGTALLGKTRYADWLVAH